MRPSFILLLAIAGLTKITTSSPLSCTKIFKDDYQLFYFHPDDPIIKLENVELETVVGHKYSGTILASICGTVEVPKECANKKTDQAKLVFVNYQLPECIIVEDDNKWNYEMTQNEAQQKMFVISQETPNHHKIDFNFVCEENAGASQLKVRFNPNTNTFTIVNESNAGCGISLDFFKTLHENKLLTAITFTIIGVVLCFLGLKLYKDFLMFFIPLLILILGFYFYISLVQSSPNQDERIMLIFFMILSIMVVMTLAVLFSNVIFFVICVLTGFQLGTLLHAYLVTQVEFFSNAHTQYIPIALITLALVFFYLKMKDYFIIVNTAILGSFSLVLSLPYYGLTEFDFLFNIEMDKFDDIKTLDVAFLKLLGLFALIALLGTVVQYALFKKKEERRHPHDDMRIDLKLTP